ncbi:unnamed protein product [Pseudo-nitzschia multistriata]|uniref:Uncharacterized protein n=1 Tax=Pseudo-nitzschia multistriata TaxID=183589 RepID=A0A448ZPD2_9STRA|nr:unnamed protein product [Pseudo-nitzschia multistriata]
MNLNQRSSTTWYYNWGAYTNSIPNFSSETRLFEDSNYFPEIMYNGTETEIPPDEEFCEGGYFYRADHYEEEDVKQTLISIKKLGVYDSSEDVGVTFCTMVTTDTARDGGLNDHFMSTYYDPTPGLTFELGANAHTFSGLIGWTNVAGYNYEGSDAIYERFGWNQDVHVIVDCPNSFCYSTYQGYFYLPNADKNGYPLTSGLVFRLTVEEGGVWVYTPRYRLTDTTNAAAYQKTYGVFTGETITLAYAPTGYGKGYWYREGENAQFNATKNQFSINGGDATVDPHDMNVLCYDYTGDMCSYYPSYDEFWDNQLFLEGGGSRFLEEDADNADEPNGSFGEEDSNTRGLEGLDDADEYALVGGEGTILLDFSRRRNLDGAQGRSLQAAEEPVLRTFSLDATVAPGTDEIGSLRTAGGNRLQKSMGVLGFLAWATAVAVLVW